jgi:hypothetical protein
MRIGHIGGGKVDAVTGMAVFAIGPPGDDRGGGAFILGAKDVGVDRHAVAQPDGHVAFDDHARFGGLAVARRFGPLA